MLTLNINNTTYQVYLRQEFEELFSASFIPPSLPVLSNSIVSDLISCPVYGTIRHIHKRQFMNSARALALEAGGAMHEVFAAMRLWQLATMQQLPQHAQAAANRLFTEDRWSMCTSFIDDVSPEAFTVDNLINIGIEILNSGEYYDDPNDAIRTIANMETTAIRYAREFIRAAKHRPIWVHDKTEPDTYVGVELVLEAIVCLAQSNDNITPLFRFIGTIDGITYKSSTDSIVLRTEENKTASRLDSTFRARHRIAHQDTGYIILLKLLFEYLNGTPSPDDPITPEYEIRVLGIKYKQSRSEDDYVDFLEMRDYDQYIDWQKRNLMALEFIQRYASDPLSAPQFDHSCTRFFRPCQYLDLCTAPLEDRYVMLEQMVEAKASPSELAVLEQER